MWWGGTRQFDNEISKLKLKLDKKDFAYFFQFSSSDNLKVVTGKSFDFKLFLIDNATLPKPPEKPKPIPKPIVIAVPPPKIIEEVKEESTFPIFVPIVIISLLVLALAFIVYFLRKKQRCCWKKSSATLFIEELDTDITKE